MLHVGEGWGQRVRGHDNSMGKGVMHKAHAGACELPLDNHIARSSNSTIQQCLKRGLLNLGSFEPHHPLPPRYSFKPQHQAALSLGVCTHLLEVRLLQL